MYYKKLFPVVKSTFSKKNIQIYEGEKDGYLYASFRLFDRFLIYCLQILLINAVYDFSIDDKGNGRNQPNGKEYQP